MKPKKGDLTFDKNCSYKAVIIWEADSVYDFTNNKIATDADLAEMGLVRKEQYEDIAYRYNVLMAAFFKAHGGDISELDEPTITRQAESD